MIQLILHKPKDEVQKKEVVKNIPYTLEDLKVAQGAGYRAGVLKINGQARASFTVYPSPFNNCQSWSIASFYSLLNITGIVNLHDLIISIRSKFSGKYMLIVDVNRTYVARIEKALRVVGKTDYKSSNGSNMTVMVIDTRYNVTEFE